MGETVDGLRQTLRKRHSAAANADQGEVFRPPAFLDDFMRQPLKRAVDFLGGEQLSFFYDAHLAAHPNIDRGRFVAAESVLAAVDARYPQTHRVTFSTCGTLFFGEFARVGTRP